MILLQRPRTATFAILGLAGAALAMAALASGNQGQVREITVTGRDHRFAPGRIEVRKDDLVKITFTADDIAHSFTLDSYRIAKRAGAGQTVVFEFRADQSGTFPFYCNLTQDERCRQMKGELVVR
jgi:heme/copper-type cytochrome/quinol oxidase subunit 2